MPPNGDDNPFAWLTAQRIILAGVVAVQQSAAAAAGASATVSAAGWPAARLRPGAPLGPPQFTSTLDQLTVASFHPHHQPDTPAMIAMPTTNIRTVVTTHPLACADEANAMPVCHPPYSSRPAHASHYLQ